MPKEVLHLLYGYEEAKGLQYGEALHIDTRGIEHVVVQVEKKRYSYPKKEDVNGAVVEANGQKLLTHQQPRKPRAKNHPCRWCKKPLTIQGSWKHEQYCSKNPKPTKRKGD